MTRGPQKHRWPAWVFGVVVFMVAAVAAAQSMRVRTTGVQWVDGVPRLSVSAGDLANARVRDELGDGLRKRIVLTVQAYPVGSTRLIANYRRECQVTYDLWEEAYVIRVGRRAELSRGLAGVVRRCLTLDRLPVGSAESWSSFRGRDVFFAVRAEFNPISRSRCRQLLRPTGGDDPIGPIVVNIVRREICRAERAVDFRSGTVRVP